MVGAQALNPAIKFAGVGMQALKPIFSLETKLQALVLGKLGGVDVEDVKAELAAAAKEPCVIYSYGLSPFSTEALALLEETGAKFENRQLGLEWFLLGPPAGAVAARPTTPPYTTMCHSAAP